MRNWPTLFQSPDEGWQVYTSAQAPDGKCLCTAVIPVQGTCSRDLRSHQLRQLMEKVQNISQSMEVLDLRTYRDLQYVRNTESLMKGLDSRLKVAAESQKSLNAKSFQQGTGLFREPPGFILTAKERFCLGSGWFLALKRAGGCSGGRWALTVAETRH
ncbi:hypothetical protein llap_21234 [Limosa lapponica baueri]|uniref:Noelin domain-containing protein n=1 Tax=Limosa lapponica baueri TaxID=1758121 RepID=A0A2I0T3V0_LIMLA|nr:hypothetical protein llap_21234 [Limosa lapponica baueri]